MDWCLAFLSWVFNFRVHSVIMLIWISDNAIIEYNYHYLDSLFITRSFRYNYSLSSYLTELNSFLYDPNWNYNDFQTILVEYKNYGKIFPIQFITFSIYLGLTQKNSPRNIKNTKIWARIIVMPSKISKRLSSVIELLIWWIRIPFSY